MDRRKRMVVGALLFGVGVVNMVVCFVIAIILGGNALNGKIEDGHYYLAQHSELTEVSRSVWLYSCVHFWTVIAYLPVMIVGGLMNTSARGLLTPDPPGWTGRDCMKETRTKR